MAKKYKGGEVVTNKTPSKIIEEIELDNYKGTGKYRPAKAPFRATSQTDDPGFKVGDRQYDQKDIRAEGLRQRSAKRKADYSHEMVGTKTKKGIESLPTFTKSGVRIDPGDKKGLSPRYNKGKAFKPAKQARKYTNNSYLEGE